MTPRAILFALLAPLLVGCGHLPVYPAGHPHAHKPHRAPATTNRCANAMRHLEKADRFAARGKYNAAEAQYRVATKLAPDCACGYRDLGYVLIQMRKVEEAIRVIEVAVLLDAADGESHLYLAEALQMAGEPSRARLHMREAEQLGADVPLWLRSALDREMSAATPGRGHGRGHGRSTHF